MPWRLSCGCHTLVCSFCCMMIFFPLSRTFLVLLMSLFKSIFRMQPTTIHHRVAKDLTMRAKFWEPIIFHLSREHKALLFHHDLIEQTTIKVYIHQHPCVVPEGAFMRCGIYNERGSYWARNFHQCSF